MIGEAFGVAVRAARLRHGMTQEHLARGMGRTQTWLSYIEGGHREPALADLDALCRALGITFPLASQESPAEKPWVGCCKMPGYCQMNGPCDRLECAEPPGFTPDIPHGKPVGETAQEPPAEGGDR